MLRGLELPGYVCVGMVGSVNVGCGAEDDGKHDGELVHERQSFF